MLSAPTYETRRAKWDADQVRDEVGDYVVEHLHDDEAVLVVDETGDVKKGTDTVGVQRQYTGTAGRIENAQVAVYLVNADRREHAAVDRSSVFRVPGPPIPAAAGPPASVPIRSSRPSRSPARMVTRFLDAGHRAAWAAGGEVYGGNPRLRTADYNYFPPDGSGCGAIRLTDIDGQQLTIDGIAVRADAVQHTGQQFTPAGPAARRPAGTRLSAGDRRALVGGCVSHVVVQAVPFRVKPEGLAKAPLEVPWNPKVT
ncbi:transposase [Streptomyces massasporeus]|uniref:transposase n=1 Tax=Streptomyces massasporeus TaxID=67324 RepID=UPI0036E1C95C